MPNTPFKSGLTIRIPKKKDMCSDARMARMRAKAPPGWLVGRDKFGICYYYNPETNNSEPFTPKANMPPCSGSACSYLGGYKTRSHRKKKSKTQKRRK